MGNIKKINGHNVKDEVARLETDTLLKELKTILDRLDLLEDELHNLELYINTKLEGGA